MTTCQNIIEIVGPTGAAGPLASSSRGVLPTFLVQAALNTPFLTLANSNPFFIIPINFVTSGNTAGISRFDTSRCLFKVLTPGLYQIHFSVECRSGGFGVAGDSFSITLRQNLISLTSSRSTLPFAPTGFGFVLGAISGSWTGHFLSGDEITLVAKQESVGALQFVQGARTIGIGPFPTILTIESLF